MKKTKLYLNEISEEPINDLVQTIDEIDEINEETDEITIYFNSPGGLVTSAKILIDYLQNCNRFVNLVAVGEISSSAFFIFFGDYPKNIKRRILSSTYGIMHKSSADLNTKEIGRKNSYDSFLYKNVINENTEIVNFCYNLGFNEQEMNLLKENEDVYLDYVRLNEFLKDVIK